MTRSSRECGLEDAQVVAMLVRRCIAGDVVAWEEIVQRYNRRIYNICYRFAGSGDDAQDLTQEVFIKMFRTLNSYDVERGAFMTWVTTITRNLLVDHFRKSKQDRVTDSLDDGAVGTRRRHAAEREDRRQGAGAGYQRAEPRDPGTGAQRPAETFARTARGGHPARPAGYGLQRHCHGTEGSGGHGEIKDKSRAGGTCAAATTYI